MLSQFLKYHPSGNRKFNYLGIFQSFELRIVLYRILSISLKLNFTPNTSGCYGLKNTEENIYKRCIIYASHSHLFVSTMLEQMNIWSDNKIKKTPLKIKASIIQYLSIYFKKYQEKKDIINS